MAAFFTNFSGAVDGVRNFVVYVVPSRVVRYLQFGILQLLRP